MKNFFKHLKVVTKHRYLVFKHCVKCGLFFRGLVHDLSKFSWVEFSESVKYFKGTGSPISKCREENGYSLVLYIIRYRLFKNPLHARHVHDGCLALDNAARFLIAEHPPVLVRAYQTAIATECGDNQMLECFFEGL